MLALRFDGTFATWRQAARRALLEGLAPHQLQWLDEESTPGLFDEQAECAPQPNGRLRVSPELLEMLESAARYRGEERWSLLYRVLWRFTRGERSAVLAGDADGSELQRRLKAVRREAHHLHAFARFQPCQAAGAPDFVAWFEPAHDVLASASEHFAERLGRHSWLIATPRDGVLWDGDKLQHQRQCPAQWRHWAQQPNDDGQALWLAYYGSTFNPARLNRTVMQQHLPQRFWKHLPEGPLIPQLMSEARAGGQRDGQTWALAGKQGKRIGAIRERGAERPAAAVSGSDGPDLPR